MKHSPAIIVARAPRWPRQPATVDPGTRAATATTSPPTFARVETRRQQKHSQSHVQSDSGHLRWDDLNEPSTMCVRARMLRWVLYLLNWKKRLHSVGGIRHRYSWAQWKEMTVFGGYSRLASVLRWQGFPYSVFSFFWLTANSMEQLKNYSWVCPPRLSA